MWDFIPQRREEILFASWQHFSLVAQCLVLATVLAVVISALVYRNATASGLANGLSAMGLTIPSFALIGLLIAPFGFGVVPAVIVVTFFATLPILRNAVVGLSGIPASVVESARGIGMGRLRTLATVEIPMAWPVILTGMRVSAQMVMGIAAIAAFASGPGLGNLIFRGIASLGSANALNQVLAGTLGIVVLALLFDGVYVLIGRLTVPRGIRV